jgi:hypothetical protein
MMAGSIASGDTVSRDRGARKGGFGANKLKFILDPGMIGGVQEWDQSVIGKICKKAGVGSISTFPFPCSSSEKTIHQTSLDRIQLIQIKSCLN